MRLFSIFLFVLSVTAPSVHANPERWATEWPNTNFSKSSVEWIEILSGGPPKDGIPAIDDPYFIRVAEDEEIADREPVMTVEIDGHKPRAYPIRYLMWHEIVNDQIGDIPITVTFCPLCNSGLTFDRRVDGQVNSFGVSGKLRNSDMVMYYRLTESWWQQFTGEAIVGSMLGTHLTKIPSWMESWHDFKARNPEGLVMDVPKTRRAYGRNPYEKYDSSRTPFLFNGEMPPFEIPALSRVVVVGDTAWPLSRLSEMGELTENGLRIIWTAGTASALDAGAIAQGRDVGAIRVQDANSRKDVAHDVAFAFAFHAFHPDGTWMLGD